MLQLYTSFATKSRKCTLFVVTWRRIDWFSAEIRVPRPGDRNTTCEVPFHYIGITGYRIIPIVTAITIHMILVTNVDQKIGIYASL